MKLKRIKLQEFIQKYVSRNTLCRLWKPLEDGNKIMLLDTCIMEWEILEIPELYNSEFIHITDIVCDSSPEAINIVIDTPYTEIQIEQIVEIFRIKRMKELYGSRETSVPNVVLCGSYKTINLIGEGAIEQFLYRIIGRNITITMPRHDLDRNKAYENYVEKISNADIVVILLKNDGSMGDATAYELALAKFFEKEILYLDPHQFE